MEEDVLVEDEPVRETRVGERLKNARKEAGLELSQVAAETRIPQRHLIAIEAGEFATLPSRTYAIGFSRTYARLLGLDEHEVIAQVREELATDSESHAGAPAKFEPGDPGRVPGRGLAWFGVLAAVIFIGGLFAFYRSYFAPGLGPAPLAEETRQIAADEAGSTAAQAPAQAAARPAGGPVVFTALMDDTWVKFYDASGERLFEAQMAEGDSFTIPEDAEGPQVWTGRPYALAITVGGQEVPKISEEDEVVKDVPVTAEALLARDDTPPSPDPDETAGGPTGA